MVGKLFFLEASEFLRLLPLVILKLQNPLEFVDQRVHQALGSHNDDLSRVHGECVHHEGWQVVQGAFLATWIGLEVSTNDLEEVDHAPGYHVEIGPSQMGPRQS